MSIWAIIPARMGSSRFYGKPMKEILGKPMIGHVYQRVSMCTLLERTIVATCDTVIFDYITSIGGEAVMTSDKHERASDRCAEAMLFVEKHTGSMCDIAVMVQGDEPMTHPEMINEAVLPMTRDSSIDIVNLVAPIKSIEEFQDRNCIKVVCDLAGNALCFSREPIPTLVKEKNVPMNKQVCIIPFRRDFLLEYNRLTPTPLEVAESVDMMRVLEHGKDVKMIPTAYETHAVDTVEDLAHVQALMSAPNFK